MKLEVALRALVPVGLATLAAMVPLAAAGEGSKRLGAALEKANGAGKEESVKADDPRIAEAQAAIDATGKENDADAAKVLLATLMRSFPNPTVEVAVAETTRSALVGLTSPEARGEVRGVIEKKKADGRIVVQLAPVVASWDEAASAATLGTLLGQKEERMVIAGARAMRVLNRRECVQPLITAFGALQEIGGEPFEAVGAALVEITGQRLKTVDDWNKWLSAAPADWDPKKKAGNAPGGTVARNFQEDAPSMFETVAIRSKKVVIILDTSGSMHIKNYIREPSEPAPPPPPKPTGDGTQSRDPQKTTEKAPPPGGGAPPAGGGGANPPAGGGGPNTGTSLSGPPLPPGIDPDKPGYKPKSCGFAQCPGARGHGPPCPSDDNLPKWFSRLDRLKRQVVKVITAFKPNTRFDIVTFSTDARTWQKGLMSADEKNKRAAIDFVNAQRADGCTCALKAFDAAFAVEEADTFIFVTDGAPTNPAGQPFDPSRWRELQDEVKRLNKVRQVRIDVITMAEGHTAFAQGVARENGGQYAQVP